MRGNEIVFTHGVFDLLHSNHVEMLKEAKAFGDYLLVAVHADDVVRGYKRDPVLGEVERLKQVCAIQYVDEAFIDPLPLVAEAMEQQLAEYNVAHYVYCGSGWDDHFAPAVKHGVLRRLPYHDGISTSAIIELMRGRIKAGTL